MSENDNKKETLESKTVTEVFVNPSEARPRPRP